ncbi:GNAT family N-acetyltransferase [Streptomyces sp. NPDC048606]|uniref:GNAT family N-acetyltransferase n=1 Tax=Streptomyces sp. NPDC048606 TaxID=3154726 RepID=UPI0034483362
MAERRTGPIGPASFDDHPPSARCAEVLSEAFAWEPATVWITGGSARTRRAWFDATLRTQAGLPGARRHLLLDGGGLPVAAAVLTPPGAAPRAPALLAWSGATLTRCGPRALSRTLRYVRATEPEAPPGAWTLEFVGVRPALAGRGAGRLLLDHVLAGAPAPGGVFLTTADAANVALYRRFGFTTLRSVAVGPVETTAMWRPAPTSAP